MSKTQCWNERHRYMTWNAGLGVVVRWNVCPFDGGFPLRMEMFFGE